MFGINGDEFLILIVLALVVIGPERLPRYAEQLGGWVRTLRRMARDARVRAGEELGGSDIDWQRLDPRQYDPRRIVREALRDDPDGGPGPVAPAAAAASPGPAAMAAGSAAAVAGRPVQVFTGTPSGVAPYDDEAT